MIKRLYIERAILDHPRAQNIIRHTKLKPIICEHYGEIINSRRQDFRLQKQAQSLVLATRQGKRIHPAQPGYSIVANSSHYYFSHLLNCPYDCSYCFLQGRYHSAHLVLFINYEDFSNDIRTLCTNNPCFFSGYDSDSLALEPLSGFAEYMVTVFRKLEATLELRTRSLQLRNLYRQEPCANVVLAFSISPDQVRQAMEPMIPNSETRLRAMKKLGTMGWPLGLRFEPVIDYGDTMANYRQLIAATFKELEPGWIHSATISPLHMPNTYFQRAARRNPEVALYAQPLQLNNGIRSYTQQRQQQMLTAIKHELEQYMPAQLVYCYSPGQEVAA